MDTMVADYMEDSNRITIDDHKYYPRIRRDSIAHLQGVGGVSWGSLSIGSWLRDEVMLHTAFNKPSQGSRRESINLMHPISMSSGRRSSVLHPHHMKAGSPPVSYNAILPNLEEQYCKDYSCCGISLPGLHDLLKHYEDAHIEPSHSTHKHKHGTLAPVNGTVGSQLATSSTNNDLNTPQHMNIIRQQLNHDNLHEHQVYTDRQMRSNSNAALGQQYMGHVPHSTVSESPSPTSSQLTSTQTTPLVGKNTALSAVHTTPSFGQSGHRMRNNGNLIDSVPTNDVFMNIMNQNNDSKTVPPDFQNHTISFSNYNINFSENIAKPSNIMPKPLDNSQMNDPLENNTRPDILNTSQRKSGISQVFAASHAAPDQLSRSNTDENGNLNDGRNVNTSKEAQTVPIGMKNNSSGQPSANKKFQSAPKINANIKTDHPGIKNAGLLTSQSIDPARRVFYENDENKPFKCPVLGCGKTYKNQNGLKYHRLHGHQNQTLIENPDGTYSVVDPESNEIYLENLQDIKDKPYRCDTCGKRYKNLNGLKYHRGHSTH
ncbi:Zinc finger C2H2 type domain signature [Nakaseomyces glabratus]